MRDTGRVTECFLAAAAAYVSGGVILCVGVFEVTLGPYRFRTHGTKWFGFHQAFLFSMGLVRVHSMRKKHSSCSGIPVVDKPWKALGITTLSKAGR